MSIGLPAPGETVILDIRLDCVAFVTAQLGDTFCFMHAYLEIWGKEVSPPLLNIYPVLRFVSVAERPGVRPSNPAIASPSFL